VLIPQSPIQPKTRERGIAVLFSAALMFFTIGSVGLAVDGGMAYLVKARVSAAVDSASLGAARGLNLGASVDEANQFATQAAKRFFIANFPDHYMRTNPADTIITATFENILNAGAPSGILKVSVTAEVVLPTGFFNLFGVTNMRVSATGTATRRTLVMVMILDTSGSMGFRAVNGVIPTSVDPTTQPCDAIVYASSKFLDYFSSYDYVGLVTFDNQALLRYAPSTNFKRGDSAGLNAVLKDITCPGGTHTTPSINMAWDAIRNVGLKMAMNEIILFTDGAPNRGTAVWPVRFQRDTRYGPAASYPSTNGTPDPPQNNPANANLFFRDSNNPFSPTTYYLNPNVTPTLDPPYTPTQQMQINNGVLPRYGDNSFLPLTTAQFNKYNTLPVPQRNNFGWYLHQANAPSYEARWIVDPAVPAGNYFDCRALYKNCVAMPLPSTTGSPATWQSTFSAYYSNVPNFTNIFNSKPYVSGGPTWTSPPTGFPNPTTGPMDFVSRQSIAYIGEQDMLGNSNYGYRDDWLFWVNEGCAPPGTILPFGSEHLCRMRGAPWADFPDVGLGSNRFPAGHPYAGKLRPDLPQAFMAATFNSAVSAANRAKSDTDYNIRFDSVYLTGGDGYIDREFLQIIANLQVFQPTIFDGVGAGTQGNNPFYNPNHQQGIWYFTTNPADLASLFAQIAGSLLRLSA